MTECISSSNKNMSNIERFDKIKTMKENVVLSDNDTKERFFLFDQTPVDESEIENGCYDIVIVEGWQPDQVIDHDQVNWTDEGEILAEISVEYKSPAQQTRSPSPETSDECSNLSWLLNFKLDELIKTHCENGEPSLKKAKREFVSWKVPQETQECVVTSTASDRKPPYTYTELIELALRERGELTVSGIYNWISERFPFFKPHDDRWKNSIRHNLSINPHFRKGAKPSKGAGHLWTIAASSAALDKVLASCEARRTEAKNLEQKVAAAAASILQHHSTEFLNPVSAEEVAAECGLLVEDFDIKPHEATAGMSFSFQHY